ncbi:hypothetical protein [Spiroplasma phoeniceum]|uniref:hypothetical protein n=1 Tax=Spiroplasma phoeniceum TaxID=47835 RepID=UPI00164B8DE1|nr:hypothetical protein [Spiroplasma phoeniceum]
MAGIWTGLTSALWKVKEGITNILPEIMVFLGVETTHILYFWFLQFWKVNFF